MFRHLIILSLLPAGSIFAYASNDPIPGVDVIVEKVPPGHVVYRGSTDKEGSIRIKSLPAGQYRVRDGKKWRGLSDIRVAQFDGYGSKIGIFYDLILGSSILKVTNFLNSFKRTTKRIQ